MVRDNAYRQLICDVNSEQSQSDTIIIDHILIFTNIPDSKTESGGVEAYFSDRKIYFQLLKLS